MTLHKIPSVLIEFLKNSFRIIIFFILPVTLWTGCNKLDTTNIGGDLIPEVDNINTFADTLDIISTQNWFDHDSTKLGLTEEYAIGTVNDPLMGQTDAKLFMQIKPPFYPYFIGKVPKDTIVSKDSAVLCLSFKSFWGDSTVPLKLKVFEVAQVQDSLWDSVYMLHTINYSPNIGNALSDEKVVDIRTLSNYTKVGPNDSASYQVRIKLNNSFLQSFFERDSVQNSPKNAFYNDTLFRKYLNGFCVQATAGNALLYVNLLDFNTRLELHYKKRTRNQENTAYLDSIYTVYSNLYFNSQLQGEIVRKSAVCNKITRTRNPLPPGDQKIYLETTPGTYANLSIPGLENYPNRVIHRAELQISQIPDLINDKIYSPSRFLYLDLIDTGSTQKWKPIYFDLNPNAYYDPDYKLTGYPYYPYNGEDLAYFGGYLRSRATPAGEQFYYNFNITKYVQQISTQHTHNYQMRVFPAHSFSYPQYASSIFPYRNAIAYGRTVVGGGANPDPSYRMRLRIIYSIVK